MGKAGFNEVDLNNYNVRCSIIIRCQRLAFLVVVIGFQHRRGRDSQGNDVRENGGTCNDSYLCR